jgi:TetR/AcrR family transcriptional regulator, transcriptional repressor for nem operon
MPATQARAKANESRPHQARRIRSHAKILGKAARMMRERGLAGASVNDVMGAAGLTRGGFYAHFPDKDEMVVEALDRAFAEAMQQLITSIPEEGDGWLERALGRYLSERHVDSPGTGCAVPALGADVARSAPTVKRAFQRGVSSMLQAIEKKLATADGRDAAITLLSTWVGALTLARAVQDRALSREILDVAKRAGRGRRKRSDR